MLFEPGERAAAVRDAVLGVRIHLGIGELKAGRLEHRVPAEVSLTARLNYRPLCTTLEYFHLLALSLKQRLVK
jgi:hypothetical protein